jgi:hypothetical protein
VSKIQASQLREQHHQQAGFPDSKLVQHNEPPRPFVTIEILAIQILTERPWPHTPRNKTAINPQPKTQTIRCPKAVTTGNRSP